MMYLVAIAWLYVALMMAVAEASSPVGSVLGAVITFLLYGLAPVALLMYLLGTPNRLRARKAAERAADASAAAAAVDPDRSGQAPAVAVDDAVAPERKEP
jgi:acetyl-CoA acetyltransferase